MHFDQTCLVGPASNVGGPVPPWPITGYAPAAGELRCYDSAIKSVLEDIDSVFILKKEQRNARWHLSMENMFLPSFLRGLVKV